MNFMNSGIGKLVSFRNRKDFEIIGVLFQQNTNNATPLSVHENKKIIIHIHGSFGNFYQNKFIWYMSTIYCEKGIDFLSINTSSHDGLAEGYYGKNLKYVGGAVSNYNDSQLDIEATIEFVKSIGYNDIVLQGHSLGCDKVIEYVLNSQSCNLDIILLSPADSYAVQSDWISPETVSNQISRLTQPKKKNNGKDLVWGNANFDWLDSKEYGAHGSNEDWIYEIPITRNALLNILTGSAFQNLNINNNPKFYADINAIAYIGKNDGLLFCTPQDFADFLNDKFKTFTPIIDIYGDHDLIGVETDVINRIVKWIYGR